MKPHAEFHKDKARRDGLATMCKSCNCARASAWHQENRERSTQRQREYYGKNGEAMRATMAAYRQRNLESVRAMRRAWSRANPDRKRALDVRWQAANRHKVRLYKRASQARRRQAVLASPSHHTAADVQRLIRLQRNRCACCGKSLKSGFHIDHRMPLKRGGSNSRENIELLCPRCNGRKSGKDPILFMQEQGRLI